MELPDFTDPRHQFGFDAESAAADWLRERGWQIEAHRWRLGQNDLDLVARKADLVAFIEVKARRGNWCGDGLEALHKRKRAAIERVAWSWILRNGRSGDRYRFDVITLRGSGPDAAIEHMEDAWRPGWR
jgi:putative endonuclease